MPWNSNEGGNKNSGGQRPKGQSPWGAGPGNGEGNGQGPWGSGPNGGPNGPQKNGGNNRGGSTPPDLDELLRRAKERFKGNMSGEGNPKGIFIGVIAAAALFWLYLSMYQVQPDQAGIVLRLGAYNHETGPGLHFAPWPVDRVTLIQTGRENKTLIGGSNDSGLMLTGDQNMVDIQFNVLWQITNPQEYLFNVNDPPKMVSDIAESAMREVVGRTSATDMMTSGKLDLQEQVRTVLQTALNSYKAGITITALTLEQVDAPQKVQDAFKEVQRAQQDQAASVNKANQYSNRQSREAEGQVAKIIQDAEGYKASVVNNARGEAEQFEQIYDQYLQSKDVTKTRIYLQTMESVLGAGSKVILQGGTASQPVMPYLPLNGLTGQTQNTQNTGKK